MPKYRAVGSVVGSKYIGEYQADSPEEAEKLAWKDADVCLCHQCADECSDGIIDEITVQEVEEVEEDEEP